MFCDRCEHHESWHHLLPGDDAGECHNYALGAGYSCECPEFLPPRVPA